MTSVEWIAEWAGVDPQDVRVLAAAMGHEGDDLPKHVAGSVIEQLNPLGERTVPELYADPQLEPWEEL